MIFYFNLSICGTRSYIHIQKYSFLYEGCLKKTKKQKERDIFRRNYHNFIHTVMAYGE